MNNIETEAPSREVLFWANRDATVAACYKAGRTAGETIEALCKDKEALGLRLTEIQPRACYRVKMPNGDMLRYNPLESILPIVEVKSTR